MRPPRHGPHRRWPAQRDARRVLDGAGEPEHLAPRGAVQRLDADEPHPPLCDSAGLVEHDGGGVARLLEHLRPLDQHAELRAGPVPTSSAVGVAKPSAHGQAMISTATAAANANAEVGAGAEPEPERRDRDRDHDRNEDGGDPVGEPLDWGLRLCLGDEPPDLGDGGIGTDMGGADDEPARDVDGRADRLVARTDLDRHALASQERGVDGGRARLDHTVGGDLLAWPDNEEVADLQRLDRDAPLLAVGAEHGDVLRAQLEQRLQRGAGAALRARLEVATHQDQDDDDRGDLEVDLTAAGARPERELEVHPHRRVAASPRKSAYNDHAHAARVPIEISSAHRRGTVPCVDERGPMEGPAAPEHDRGRELEREPLPAVELERRHHREQEHGQRQHRRDEQPEAERRGQVLGTASSAVSSLGKRGLVAGRLDRGDQLLRRDGGRVELDRARARSHS